jgi:hypothetical protein
MIRKRTIIDVQHTQAMINLLPKPRHRPNPDSAQVTESFFGFFPNNHDTDPPVSGQAVSRYGYSLRRLLARCHPLAGSPGRMAWAGGYGKFRYGRKSLTHEGVKVWGLKMNLEKTMWIELLFSSQFGATVV